MVILLIYYQLLSLSLAKKLLTKMSVTNRNDV